MLRKRKCTWCRKGFSPHPRLKDRQKSCGGVTCKRKQKLFSQKRWRKKGRNVYRKGQKNWRDKHPDYWKTYRKKHPAYTKRNRAQSKIRWTQSKLTLQKRIDILEVTEKSVKYWHLPLFAKQPRSLFPLLFAYGPPHENQSSNKSKTTAVALSRSGP